MKKFFSVISIFCAMMTTCTFTSCLEEHDENDNEYTAVDYFTVDGNASQIILHGDGGSTVIPSMASFRDPAAFLKEERYFLYLKYRMADVQENPLTITGATLLDGNVVDVNTPLDAEMAQNLLVTSADSLHDVLSVTNMWGYRGYITAVVKSRYCTKGDKGITPAFNLVYDPATMQANRLDLQLCCNQHRVEGNSLASQYYEFATSFRLEKLAAMIPGSDSIEVSISCKGITKPTTFKIGRQDLFRGNY